jgi:hypothetical protein
VSKMSEPTASGDARLWRVWLTACFGPFRLPW